MLRATSLSVLTGIRRWIAEEIRASENKKVSGTRTATRLHVYASFGMDLLRREFASDIACKEFIEKYLPECESNWKIMLAIGRHFKYDEYYLRFLDQNEYPVPPQQREEATKISEQLKELARKYGRLDTPDQLERLFESGKLIVETTAAKAKADKAQDEKEPSEVPIGANLGIDVEAPAEDEAGTEPAASPADINFNKQLQGLVFKVQNYSVVEATFNDLLKLRAASRWDPIRARFLKEALLRAEKISTMLASLLP